MRSIASITVWWSLLSRYLPLLLHASLVVVEVTVCVILLSWVVGLFLALCRTSNLRFLRLPVEGYIEFIRGTPALIQIFIVYFGLPQFGIRLSPFTAGTIALGFNSAAYVAETIRGGLLSIPHGQRESALALGLSYAATMRRVIMPQVVRVIIPPISNEAATALKNTSLLSTITLMELTLQTQIIIESTFKPFEFYFAAAVLYLIMTIVVLRALKHVEKRYALHY